MGFLEFFRKKKKVASINQEKEEAIQNCGIFDDKINEILNQEIVEFFPNKGNWTSSCFDKSNEINETYLPCHLRDNGWLSKLLQQKLTRREIYIPVSKIKKFISTSETFTKLRHNYELEIVRWQIDFMRNNGENWIMPKGFDELSMIFSPDVDKMFRGGVVETLSAIGMDRELIEEGIEKYSDMWREQYMNKAFSNAFDSVVYLMEGIEPADESHKQNWLKLRRYQYYTEHKISVDKYGEVTSDMLLKGAELIQLQNTVLEQNKERERFIKNARENPNHKRTSIFSDEQE